jgi:hypothetical protein
VASDSLIKALDERTNPSSAAGKHIPYRLIDSSVCERTTSIRRRHIDQCGRETARLYAKAIKTPPYIYLFYETASTVNNYLFG